MADYHILVWCNDSVGALFFLVQFLELEWSPFELESTQQLALRCNLQRNVGLRMALSTAMPECSARSLHGKP
jgi:hypothetical protein